MRRDKINIISDEARQNPYNSRQYETKSIQFQTRRDEIYIIPDKTSYRHIVTDIQLQTRRDKIRIIPDEMRERERQVQERKDRKRGVNFIVLPSLQQEGVRVLVFV